MLGYLGKGVLAQKPKVPLYPKDLLPMLCGAPITRGVHAGEQKILLPLTVSDYVSRYLLLCEVMESVKEEGAFTAFERPFQERGLPQAIGSDNGVPLLHPIAFST